MSRTDLPRTAASRVDSEPTGGGATGSESGGVRVQRYIDELSLLHALRLAVVATDTPG